MGESSYIGIGADRLYTVIEPPAGDFVAAFAVLMCYPFGEEYIRSHRAFNHLAKLLARKGVISMRFDYAGTGDSSGCANAFSLKEARHQLRCMAEELGKLAGVSDVRAVGLRLGGALAYESLGDIDAVKQIACWDPVIAGKQYLEELRNVIPPKRESDYIVDETWWVNGYPVSAHLRSEIASIDLVGVDCRAFSRVLLLSSRDDAHIDRLKKRCESTHRAFTSELIVDLRSEGWARVDSGGRYRFPNEIFVSLTDWLTA